MSKSRGFPRTYIMALIDVLPPSTLPWLIVICRPDIPGCGSVENIQSTSDPHSSTNPPGSWMFFRVSTPPASRTSTEFAALALSGWR